MIAIRPPPMAALRFHVAACVLTSFLVSECGGLASSDAPAADASVDLTVPPPPLDTAAEAEAAVPDTSGCFEGPLDSSLTCTDTPVADCPMYQGTPSLHHALGLIVAKCRKCIGSWTCGGLTVEVDGDGCTTPPVFDNPWNEQFMACVRVAMTLVRFDCAAKQDAGILWIGIDSCTK